MDLGIPNLVYRWLPAVKESSHTIITLHGRGGNMDDFLPVAERIVRPSYNFLLLQAPDPHFSGFSWYETEPSPIYGIRRTCFLLTRVFKSLRQQGYPEHTCFMMGFSQGGRMVWEFGCRYPIKLAGYIAICCQSWDVLQMRHEMVPAVVQQGDWLITHGKRDIIVSPEIAYRQCQILLEAGFNLAYQEFDKGHEFDFRQEVPFIGQWIDHRARKSF